MIEYISEHIVFYLTLRVQHYFIKLNLTIYYINYLHVIYRNLYRKWVFQTGNATSYSNYNSSPEIGPDGTVFFATLYSGGLDHGKLYAVNPDGTQKWAFQTGENSIFLSSPAIGSDGSIYLGVGSRKLIAIGEAPADSIPPVTSTGLDGTAGNNG